MPGAPWYALKPTDGFAMSITGVLNADTASLLPVRSVLNVNYERPEIVEGSGIRPAPQTMRMNVTIDISSMPVGATFVVCRWDVTSRLPSSDWQYCADGTAADGVADVAWLLTKSAGAQMYSISEELLSSDQRVYRASIYVGPRPPASWRRYFTFLIAAAVVVLGAGLFLYWRKRRTDQIEILLYAPAPSEIDVLERIDTSSIMPQDQMQTPMVSLQK
jgi:hypothetical protein